MRLRRQINIELRHGESSIGELDPPVQFALVTHPSFGNDRTLMANSGSPFYRWSPIFLSILRIVIGLLFIEHGSQKLFNFPPSPQPHEGGLHGLMLIGACLEFGGGILVLLGFFTRPVAFILSGEMAVAYFMFHAKGSLHPILNHGELAVAYCFVFLYMAVAGAGSWSVDALWRKGTNP